VFAYFCGMMLLEVGLIIVSLRIAAVSVSALVPLPLIDVGHQMCLHMLFQIPFLRKLLKAKFSLIRFDASMHTCVVKNIPSPAELFISAVVSTDINSDRVVFPFDVSELCFVLEPLQQLEVHIAFRVLLASVHIAFCLMSLGVVAERAHVLSPLRRPACVEVVEAIRRQVSPAVGYAKCFNTFDIQLVQGGRARAPPVIIRIHIEPLISKRGSLRHLGITIKNLCSKVHVILLLSCVFRKV